MFTVTQDLAQQHADVLAGIAVPMTPVLCRAMRAASAEEHRYAEAHRKASKARPRSPARPRNVRLSRIALLADARAADFLAEAR